MNIVKKKMNDDNYELELYEFDNCFLNQNYICSSNGKRLCFLYRDANKQNLDMIDVIEYKYNCDYPIFFIYPYKMPHNYFHFFNDICFNLHWYFELRKTMPKLKIYMSVPYNYNVEWKKEILNSLNITDKDFVDSKYLPFKKTLFKKIYASSQISPIAVYSPSRWKECNNIMKMMKNNINKKSLYEKYNKIDLSKKYPIKFYCSRRKYDNYKYQDFKRQDNKQNHNNINEDEIIKLCKKYDIEEIFLEEYNLYEKIKLFESAEMIVIASQAGIINLGFALNKCKVVFIEAGSYVINQCMYNITSRKGLTIYKITESKVNDDDKRPLNNREWKLTERGILILDNILNYEINGEILKMKYVCNLNNYLDYNNYIFSNYRFRNKKYKNICIKECVFLMEII